MTSITTFFANFQGRHHPQDVQILTLDDAEAPDKRQTFRREGSAEILELEHDQLENLEDTEEVEQNRLPRKQRQALEVLQEELEEDASTSPVLQGRQQQFF